MNQIYSNLDDIKHIFLDLGHTLWDFDKNSKLAYQEIFQEQDFELDIQRFLDVYIPINKSYWERFSMNEITREELRFGRLKDSFKTLNFSISDDLIIKISNLYVTYLSKSNFLIDGAISLLEYLYPKYKLHIITNGFDKVQREKIKFSNLEPYFDVVVTSDCIGFKKPNPKIYEFALQKVGALPQDCVMIGDNYQADILGAFDVGILPIHFRNSNSIENHNFVSVNRLEDIKQYL